VIGAPELRLQWGHASTGVESTASTTSRICSSVLQWGHASTGVERQYTLAQSSFNITASMGPRLNRRGKHYYARKFNELHPDCFNGATPQQAWKEGIMKAAPAKQDSFNGATPQQAWKGQCSRKKHPFHWRFNGATPQQAWKGGMKRDPGSKWICFNGATPQQAWKVSGT